MHGRSRRLAAGFFAICTMVMLAGLAPSGADPGVDLTIDSINDSPDPVIEANIVRYKVVVKNIGVSASQPVTVWFYAYETEGGGEFSIASTDPVIVSASGSGWTCGVSEGWYCDGGSLAAGQSSTPLFVYVRAPDHPTTIALNAYAYSGDSELNPYNNDATESTDVVQSSGGCETDVSCGSGFVQFDQDTSVTTGPLSAQHWLVGTTHFKGVPGAEGGIVYNMAAVKPTKICGILVGATKCTFQMNIDPIPSVYPVGNVKLTLLCHPNHCPATLPATLGLTMFEVGADNLSRPIPRCIDGLLPIVCFTAKRLGNGALKVIVKNLSPGDPKIAGRCIAGC
jgi:hypothetical protein